MSWVIRNKATGEVLFETFDKRKVDALNISKYEAVPIGDYLSAINGRCPHGFVLAENVCGPCSEGRSNSYIESAVTHE
jgi:hypothetical protein